MKGVDFTLCSFYFYSTGWSINFLMFGREGNTDTDWSFFAIQRTQDNGFYLDLLWLHIMGKYDI